MNEHAAEAEMAISEKIAATTGSLLITGGGSRAGYGELVCCNAIVETGKLTGIVAHEPSELFISAWAGTALAQLFKALDAANQELACDPPRPPSATVGGMIATGLTGPGRPGGGQVRDFLLGCRMIDGNGDLLRFGGKVIKNVAGFDVSRLVTGSLGTLGCITQATLRVRGKPPADATVALTTDAESAALEANTAFARGLPVSASCWEDGVLRLRLRGSERAVHRAASSLGGEHEDGIQASRYWASLRDGGRPRFTGRGDIWMCLLPPLAVLPFDSLGVHEWLGARRWFFDDAPTDLRGKVAAAGGAAILYRRGPQSARSSVFPVPPPALLALSRRIKKIFDARGLINAGRFGYL